MIGVWTKYDVTIQHISHYTIEITSSLTLDHAVYFYDCRHEVLQCSKVQIFDEAICLSLLW